MAKYQKNISHPLELWCAVARNVDGIMPDHHHPAIKNGSSAIL